MIKRVVLGIAFVAMLATPWMLRRVRQASEASRQISSSRPQYGFAFTEVSQIANITAMHQGPSLDPQLAHIMPQVAAMGAAVSVVDVDRDGFDDLYVTDGKEGSTNHLFRNRGDGTFEDVATALGVAHMNDAPMGVSMGSVWGDYDNDGFEDLMLYRWGQPDLFHNDAGRGFTRVTGIKGWPAWANLNTALWLDYDADGRLDLFLGGYYDERVNLWKLASTKMMPESFEYASNGGRKYLFRNLGNGQFEEVSEAMGIASRRWSLAAVAADFRGTGRPDLFLANDYGVSELFLNEKTGFREVGRSAGIGFAPKSGMNASIADIFNRGQFAIYVSNISEEGILLQGNNLWVPRGATNGVPQFQNMARAVGVELGGWSFGAQFGDLNNDGWLDLYLVNGFVSGDQHESYWYDYSKIAVGNQLVISDAKNWPAMGRRSLGGYQQKRVWMNDGAGRFQDVASAAGVTDRFDGRAVVLADLSNNGALDAIVANQRGPLLYYRNSVSSDRQWAEFELEGSCRPDTRVGQPCSNRSAIGAQVTVYWNGMKQTQEVSGGAGFCAQNQRRLHFGLGPDAKIERVVIRWPSGKQTELQAPTTNQRHKISEPS